MSNTYKVLFIAHCSLFIEAKRVFIVHRCNMVAYCPIVDALRLYRGVSYNARQSSAGDIA
jgi:hypothetical protein